MANNKIVISSNVKEKKDSDSFPRRYFNNAPEVVESTIKYPLDESLDQDVWGNDNSFLNMLNEKQLAERRLFVRAKFIQKILCNAIMDSMGAEPVLLSKPVVFMVIDISMGGIGIISESDISVGTILNFNIILDNVPYEINCEIAYCVRNDDKFRAGLKILSKDKQFIKHLKIVVARLTLQSRYGGSMESIPLNQ